MTKDDSFLMSRHPDDDTDIRALSVAQLRFISDTAYAVGAASEREAILQMSADNWYKTQKDYDSAIRARGEKK